MPGDASVARCGTGFGLQYNIRHLASEAKRAVDAAMDAGRIGLEDDAEPGDTSTGTTQLLTR